MSLAWATFLVLAALCLAAAWLDASRRRLPNWLCLATLVLGLGFTLGLSLPGGWQALGSHAGHGLAALLVGMVLFRLGVIGGGDAKFYAACATWFPLGAWAMLLLATSLAGLGLFAIWFTLRRVQRKPISRASTDPFDRLPYGLAIAMGALVAGWRVIV